MRKLFFIAFFAIVSSTAYTQLNSSQFPQNGKRYLALMLLNFDNKLENANLDMIEQAAQNGSNAVHLAILWYAIYPTATTTPDWRKIDAQVNLCVKLGLKICLRIHTAQTYEQIKNGFWTEKECMEDHEKAKNNGIYGQTTFTFAHQPSIEKAKAFIKEVCERYNHLQRQGHILWVSVTNNSTQELSYAHANWKDGDYKKQYDALYDFAAINQTAFRSWVKRKYGKISRLNESWKQQFEDFESTHPFTNTWEVQSSFRGNWGHDHYAFRQLQFKNFIEQTTATIRSVNPNYKVIMDVGAVADEVATLRGTVAFKDLTSGLDGIKTNDAVEFDNRYTMDILRSNMPLNKWIMNEAFCNPEISLEEVEIQINQNYEHGAQLETMVISTMEQFNRYKPIMQRMAAKWLPKPMEYTTPPQTITYKLSSILDLNFGGTGVYKEWLLKGGKDGKKVNVILIEDILSDTLQGSINRTPVVKNPIPNRTIAEGKFFSYKVAPEVFYDSDGTITKVEARGLPSWLAFKDDVFYGTPTESGTYFIIIRATDDEGAAVETSFTIIVDPKEVRVNKKPYQKKNIPDTTVLYKQSFKYKIPDDVFADDDGFIGRIEILNEPDWLQIKSDEMFGKPLSIGTFRVTIRAYDDDEVPIETSFKITVVYPDISSVLVGAGDPIKRVRIKPILNGDVLLSTDLPDLVNIYTECKAEFDEITLDLIGPKNRKITVSKDPYALFQGNEGLIPLAGNYKLTTLVFFNKDLISEKEIKFQILTIDPTTKKPIVLDDWSFFPNPVQNFVLIKIPASEDTNNLKFELVAMNGASIAIPDKDISVADNNVNISFGASSIPTGSYVLRISKEGNLIKTLKVIKL